jgi:uncharacterized protein (DUF885 family)
MGGASGSVRRIARPVLPMPASFRAAGARAERSSDVAEQAYDVLEKDVMLSHAFAKEEVERFTYRSPGQANSYFYGYTRLLALRREVEAALGPKFDQQKFHDFILAQGLLTPDLMRRAVLETFVPSHARQ